MNTPHDMRLDQMLLRYLDALDRQDWGVFDEIWKAAESDPQLEAALHELHQGIVEEHLGDSGRQADAEAVRRLLAEHIPQRPEPAEGLSRPLTAGDVAARIQADALSGATPLNAADRATNDQLLANSTPLPEPLKESVLEKWRQGLGVQGAGSYWRLFRKAALRLMMTRSQQQTCLAAAREQTSKPGAAPTRKDES